MSGARHERRFVAVVLVDTSMWLKRRREPVPMLDGLIASDEAATCPPVVQEILQGVRGPAGYQEAYEAIMSVHMLESPMPLEIFEQAAELYRTCRSEERRVGKECR